MSFHLSKKIFFIAVLLTVAFSSFGQKSECNKLGVWLWHFEMTGFNSHAHLADTLSSLGVKRIYVKVADGGINPDSWTELVDEDLVDAYKSKGLEVWSWSYNYPGNFARQAEVIYVAAKTGYQGHVVDVEEHFDGDSQNLFSLFSAFYSARARAIADGFAADTFPLYCTTWGNPAAHFFHVEVIDPFVDAFMPQTYVELWGTTYMNNITYWIGVGNDEYASLGATKPLHHIVATEKGIMTASQVNEFIRASGPETSVWRIPGGGVPMSVWETWRQIDWRYDFCNPSSTELNFASNLILYPNPATNYFSLMGTSNSIQPIHYKLVDIYGRIVKAGQIEIEEQVDVQQLPSGIYILIIQSGAFERKLKLVK